MATKDAQTTPAIPPASLGTPYVLQFGAIGSFMSSPRLLMPRPVDRTFSVHYRLVGTWNIRAQFKGMLNSQMMTMMMVLMTWGVLGFRLSTILSLQHHMFRQPVRTMANLNWKVPSSSALSSAAAATQPTMHVIQMRGVQRSQEQHLPDGHPNAEDVYNHRQQHQNGGE